MLFPAGRLVKGSHDAPEHLFQLVNKTQSFAAGPDVGVCALRC